MNRLSKVWAETRAFRPALVVVIVLVALFASWLPAFRTSLNIQNILTSIAVLWLASMGMTFVLISGGFDLSLGAIATFCGIFLGTLLEHAVVPGWVAVLLTILLGGVVGGVMNGIFVGIFRLSVFVVTLASMTVLTGIVLVWTKSASIYVNDPIAGHLAVSRLGGIQTPIYIMAVVFLIFLYVQMRTYFGRDIYATGGSYTAARLSGIRTERTLIAVYAVAGACAGLGGVIAVGRVGAATPSVDNGLALQAVAAVLIGGTLLTGGAGSVVGTAFGCLLIGILQNGLNLAGVGSDWQYVVTGVILLMSVLAGGLQASRAGRLAQFKQMFGMQAKVTAPACSTEPGAEASAEPVPPPITSRSDETAS
jgi:ribose/xylose/arabinose/galactoside ABC-type transport system permease subunit